MFRCLLENQIYTCRENTSKRLIKIRAMLFEQTKLTTFWDNSFISFATKK
jgi:hypothetical protein